jgi:hypothetical protein
LFDLQKSINPLPRLTPGTIHNEEALEDQMDLRARLFVPLFSPKTNNLLQITLSKYEVFGEGRGGVGRAFVLGIFVNCVKSGRFF